MDLSLLVYIMTCDIHEILLPVSAKIHGFIIILVLQCLFSYYDVQFPYEYVRWNNPNGNILLSIFGCFPWILRVDWH